MCGVSCVSCATGEKCFSASDAPWHATATATATAGVFKRSAVDDDMQHEW